MLPSHVEKTKKTSRSSMCAAEFGHDSVRANASEAATQSDY